MSLKGYIVIVFLGCYHFLLAQDGEIRNRQRALFIYNITQQVTNTKTSSFKEFTIGIMGNDPVTAELKKLQQENRTVKGKPISLIHFQSIQDIIGVQLIYVNNELNYDISELLKQVEEKNILVVSEGYEFNTSMINIIEINGTFQFEINKTRLNQANFMISEPLERLAINSSDRWQELYRQSAESLVKEREKVAKQHSLMVQQQTLLREQQKLMSSQQAQILEQISQIDIRNVIVEQLQVKIDDQQNLFDDKTQAIQKLESQLNREKLEIERKKKELVVLDKTLEKQRDLASNQASYIESQGETLEQQQKFIALMLLLFLLTLVIGFIVWRNYRVKRKLIGILAKKNEAIEVYSKELERKSQDMEQFAYVASHDLQAPLASINGLMALIDIKQLDEGGKRGIQLISEASTRMSCLIDGLLEYSKLGSEVTFKSVDCNKIIKDVQDNLKAILEQTNADLDIDNLPTLVAHEVKLTLLFQNLISNALKFTKPDTTPMISVSAKEIKNKQGEGRWQFKVKDNGIGIAKANVEKIFLIFHRLHGVSEYEGTGIGLAHCKKIVDLHRGDIWVESEVGKGSSFYFTI